MSLTVFLNALTGRLYKILPMREHQLAGEEVYLECYLCTLSLELEGAGYTFPCLCDDADYITILNTVNGIDCEDDVRLIRRETFKMLHLLDNIKCKYGVDDDA